MSSPLRHLTFVGAAAGATLCGSARAGGEVHFMFAPLGNPAFRNGVCRACLRAVLHSYEAHEEKPAWACEIEVADPS